MPAQRTSSPRQSAQRQPSECRSSASSTPEDQDTAGFTAEAFARDVAAGLTAEPKVLQPKYFYDELGSRLFEAICALPEYYVTRAETAILEAHAPAIIAAAGPSPLRLVELGSGDAVKTRFLIEALLDRQPELDFTAIDISASALEKSGEEIHRAYPQARFHPYEGDYLQGLAALGKVARGETTTLVLFLGSTLGNLHAQQAVALLHDVRSHLQPGDALLLGVDLKKAEEVLIPAYDDALGVTAAFNLNLLLRINRELGGDFDLTSFAHRAVYNREVGRMEMHIVSRVDQSVYIETLDLEIAFAAGEHILSECSYKFDREQISSFAAASGFEVVQSWTDPRGWFSSNLLLVR